MNISVVIIIGIATYYLYHIIRHLDGPFNIFTEFRELIGFEYKENDDSISETIPDNFIGSLLSCVYCSSFWISLTCHILFNSLEYAVIGALASAGISSIIYRAVDKLD